MNRENLDFLYAMFPHHKLEDLDIVIVNQTTETKQLYTELNTVKIINSFEKGLSKSRNLALQNATSNWCLIADDDLVYVKEFEKNIKSGIKKFNTSGVIIFQAAIDESELMRSYPKESKLSLSTQEKFHVASFEILVNRKTLADKVFFNPYFGLGSGMFNCGEEQVFMNDVHTLGLQISFFKETTVRHPWLSTGREYEKEGRYLTKGALYAKLFPENYIKWIFVQLFFDLKQSNIKLLKTYSALKEALKGVKKMKQLELCSKL